MFVYLFCFAGTECSVSMDSVLQKRYQRKLEHWVVPLYETLPPTRHLSVYVVVPPQLVGSSTMLGSQPVSKVSLTLDIIHHPSSEPSTDDVVDSKDGIIANVRQAAEKRKAAQAMSGPAPKGSSG